MEQHIFFVSIKAAWKGKHNKNSEEKNWRSNGVKFFMIITIRFLQ